MPLAQHRTIPASHPVHQMFRRLAHRGLSQVRLAEADLESYLGNLLVRFVHVDGLYRLRDERGVPLKHLGDMLALAHESDARSRPDALRHVGDYALFVLGFYPESLTGRRKIGGLDFYVEHGRRSYTRAAEMFLGTPTAPMLRKLADRFETCAVALHWVREYTHDPFYQYMLRQFGNRA